jgi:hypothetical protein
MEKPTTGEAEPLSALAVLQTVLTMPGRRGRPEDSVTGAVHMAIFRHGYEFQSRVLRIPDRYGFFWPSPLEVQQEQGNRVALLIFTCAWIMVFCMSFALLSVYDNPEFALVVISLGGGYNCLYFVLVWVLSFFDDRRKTDSTGMV